MSKHQGNLKRLSVKLQLRFGDDDALLQQVRCELALHQATEVPEPLSKDWSIPYRQHIQNVRGAMALH
jgi:hypothetical protein